MVIVRQLLLQVPAITTSMGVVGIVTNHTLLKTDTDNEAIIYYIDQNGYIVSSSELTCNTSYANETYRFFGSEQPIVFEDLIRMGVFNKARVIGYDTRVCPANGNTSDTCPAMMASTSDTCGGCATQALCVSEVPFYTLQYSACASGVQSYTTSQFPQMWALNSMIV